MWRTTVWILFTCCFVKYSFGDGDEDFLFDSEPKCNVTLIKPAGTISIQKPNISFGEYIWCIEPVNKTEINLFFETLFLHEHDELNIYGSLEEAGNNTNPLIEPIHAQNDSFAVITNEKAIYVKLKVNNSAERRFRALYHSLDCTFTLGPDVHILRSPISAKNVFNSSVECDFDFGKDMHSRTIQYFTMLHFDFSISKLNLEGFSFSGFYEHNSLFDFFRVEKVAKMHITMPPSSNESFSMKIDLVDSTCSGFKSITVGKSENFKSPPYVLNNGSILHDCRWIFESADTSVLGIDFDTVALSSPLDVVAVNDGASEISSPLLHITSSSDNNTLRQSVRSSGKHLWVAFKPVSYASKLVFNVTQHGQGGHFIDNGTIAMKSTTGNDTVFLLEVEDGKVVYLNFSSSDFAPPAALSLYDGFNQDSHLLATLQGNVWYPVLSIGNKLKIIATSFGKGEFTATFNGLVPDTCMHMSNSYSEDYTLSGHCNKTCTWTIPPQNLPDKELLLNLQYVSLGKDDLIEIIQLDNQMTKLGEVSSAMNHVPQLSLPANIGAVVKVTRGSCTEEEKLVLVGHSSYVPGCNQLLSVKAGSSFHVTSPLYPDTYPIGITCTWTIESEPKTFLNLAFDKLQLASNHCVQVTYSGKKNYTFSGSDLPPDMLIPEKAVIKFLSSNCTSGKTGKELATSEGFLLNGTVADCGGNLDGPNGEFNTSLSGNQSLCIWKVSVQPTSDTTSDDVNIISYSVSKKDSTENFELHVYDGDSVRNREIINNTNSDIWSRTNSLVFEYKRINISKPATVLVFKFKLISCNASMQCTNKLCMHPDWRCDGKNDCGDFSDEQYCQTAPINPDVVMGYSSSAFFGTLFTMLILGAALGFGGHIVLQRYRNGQYRRFDDISAIG